MFYPKIQLYKTDISYLAANGLIGEQAVNDAGFPPQNDLDSLEPFSAYKEDFLDKDFDPIRINLENQWNESCKGDNVPSGVELNTENHA